MEKLWLLPRLHFLMEVFLPEALDLSNQARETALLRHPFHPHCHCGLGFKYWGLSSSPGLQPQGYCGTKGSTSLLSLAYSSSGARTGVRKLNCLQPDPQEKPQLEGASSEDLRLKSRKHKLSYPTHFKIPQQAGGGPGSDLGVTVPLTSLAPQLICLPIPATPVPHAATWRHRDRSGFHLNIPCLSWYSPFRKRKGWLADSCEKGAA